MVSHSGQISMKYGAGPLSGSESMKAVEQNSDFLNEIADAAITTPGDARNAWRVISVCFTEGRDLPDWIRAYLQTTAGKIETSKHEDMAMALGFYPEAKEPQTKSAKAFYDSLAVFSVIAGWRREAVNEGLKVSLADCFERYVSVHLNDREHEETVKTAYYRGKTIAEAEIELSTLLEEQGI